MIWLEQYCFTEEAHLGELKEIRKDGERRVTKHSKSEKIFKEGKYMEVVCKGGKYL